MSLSTSLLEDARLRQEMEQVLSRRIERLELENLRLRDQIISYRARSNYENGYKDAEYVFEMEIERLKEALAKYADRDNWEEGNGSGYEDWWQIDNGWEIADNALNTATITHKFKFEQNYEVEEP